MTKLLAWRKTLLTIDADHAHCHVLHVLHVLLSRSCSSRIPSHIWLLSLSLSLSCS
jgi:hypothetical protein